MRKLATIALLLCAASPPHKAVRPVQNAATAPVHKGMSAAEYAASVAGLDNCDDFAAKAAMLPDAAPLVTDAISDVKATTKDEFETTAQFDSRQAEYWQTRLGDPQHLVIRVPIDSFKVTYDADHGVAVVKYLADPNPSHTALKFFHHSTTTGHYVGQNAYGVKADVTSFSDVDGVLSFPIGQLGEANAYISPKFSLPLSAEQARAFKESPSLLVLAQLEAPYLDSESAYSGATIDEPESLVLVTKNVHVRLRCAVFMAGSQVISPNIAKP